MPIRDCYVPLITFSYLGTSQLLFSCIARDQIFLTIFMILESVFIRSRSIFTFRQFLPVSNFDFTHLAIINLKQHGGVPSICSPIDFFFGCQFTFSITTSLGLDFVYIVHFSFWRYHFWCFYRLELRNHFNDQISTYYQTPL